MVLTQKVSSLAFSLHDGLARRPEDLSSYQKEQVIRKIPNPLEYYSYVFHFHAVMVGPTYLFADYLDFIEGKQFARKGIAWNSTDKNDFTDGYDMKEHVLEPSANLVVFKKLAAGLICVLIFIKAAPLFPITRVKGNSIEINRRWDFC